MKRRVEGRGKGKGSGVWDEGDKGTIRGWRGGEGRVGGGVAGFVMANRVISQAILKPRNPEKHNYWCSTIPHTNPRAMRLPVVLSFHLPAVV